MTITAARIALGISALVLTAGTALSGGTTTGTLPPATCKVTQAQAVNYHAPVNARHANTTQVRYTAAHAMPPARYAAASGKGTGCNFSMNVKKSDTALD